MACGGVQKPPRQPLFQKRRLTRVVTVKLAHMLQPITARQVHSGNGAVVLWHRRSCRIVASSGIDGSHGMHGCDSRTLWQRKGAPSCLDSCDSRSGGRRIHMAAIDSARSNSTTSATRNAQSYTCANGRAPHIVETLSKGSNERSNSAVQVDRPAQRSG